MKMKLRPKILIRLKPDAEILEPDFCCRVCGHTLEHWKRHSIKFLGICHACVSEAARSQFDRWDYQSVSWGDATVMATAGRLIKILERECVRQSGN